MEVGTPRNNRLRREGKEKGSPARKKRERSKQPKEGAKTSFKKKEVHASESTLAHEIRERRMRREGEKLIKGN